MYKIKNITLRNFKFFYGLETEYKQNRLELNKDNLLLYGENGSGKSSIYWALYTFLQSYLKQDDSQIYKYFRPGHGENLRNRFSDDAVESAIEIQFENEHGSRLTKKISNSEINTKDGTFIHKTLLTSDFLNYKFLSKIYDFRNSEAIDLFPLFERNILMFIDFEEEFKRHNGSLSNTANAGDWWGFISKEWANLPKNKHTFKVGCDEYKQFNEDTIPKFIEQLKRFLIKITSKTNQILEEKFKENFIISFDLDSTSCAFNEKISQRKRSQKLRIPSISLKVRLKDNLLDPLKKDVHKPHTFLNEARLTAIALAIRLAILDEKYLGGTDDLARLLIIDDLLLSLDMNHRDVVMDIIFEKANEYQLLIFTHDRAFYNLCKRRLESQFAEGWKFKEIYQHQTETGIPCPFIPDKKNYMDLAEKYLKDFDYPASANYMRKECERLLIQKILPKHLTIRPNLDEGSKPLNLDGLIQNFFTYYSEMGGDRTPFRKLKEYKDLLLNPLSHDNIESPIYRVELERVKGVLKLLSQIKSLRIIPISEGDKPEAVLKETDSNGEIWEYQFRLVENLRALYTLTGDWLINNPKCEFISRRKVATGAALETFQPSSKIKLKKGYGNIRHYLGINKATPPKDIRQIIFYQGQKIQDILNN